MSISSPPVPTSGLASSASAVRSFALAGPAGRLEAVLNEGSGEAPFAALVCHPHPLGGGTLHNKVVYHAMKVLNDPAWGFGFPVLRFNFRGTGLSEGIHDGWLESDDVLSALSWLENAYNCPLLVAGFSFGAAMALRACCQSPNQFKVRALIALGLPTQAEGRSYQYPFLSQSHLPKLFISGDKDQYAPASELADAVNSAADPKRLLLIPHSDHFFTGQLASLQNELAGWLKEELE